MLPSGPVLRSLLSCVMQLGRTSELASLGHNDYTLNDAPPFRPKVVVKKSGGCYYAEDKDRDVTVQIRVKRLGLIPTFLGK